MRVPILCLIPTSARCIWNSTRFSKAYPVVSLETSMISVSLFPFPSSVVSWNQREQTSLQHGHPMDLKESRTVCSLLSCVAFLKFPGLLLAFSATARPSAGVFMKRCPVAPNLRSSVSAARLEPARVYGTRVFLPWA